MQRSGSTRVSHPLEGQEQQHISKFAQLGWWAGAPLAGRPMQRVVEFVEHDAALDEEMLRDAHGDADASDLEDHGFSLFVYEDDCFVFCCAL